MPTAERKAKKKAKWRAAREKAAAAVRANCPLTNGKYYCDYNSISDATKRTYLTSHCNWRCKSFEYCMAEIFKMPINCSMGDHKKMKNVKYQAACVECRLAGTRCLWRGR